MQNLPSELIEQLGDPRARHRLGRMLDSLIGGALRETREIYGSMWGDDITQAVTIASANVGVEVGGSLTAGKCSGFTFQSSKELVCQVPGEYQVSWGMSLGSTNNNENISGGIMVNAAEQHQTEGSAQAINGSKPTHVSGCGSVTLALNDVVKFYVENETAAHNITVYHASLFIKRIE